VALNFILWFYDLDLVRAKANHHCEYLGQRSFCSKVIMQTHRHTRQTDCTTWTTKCW